MYSYSNDILNVHLYAQIHLNVQPEQIYNLLNVENKHLNSFLFRLFFSQYVHFFSTI